MTTPRSTMLSVGGLSLLGTGLADLSRLEAEVITRGSPRAKSVVFIFQSGGPSQHETFDPKPEAPDGIRGEYATTQTRLPGTRFCEYLPKLAARLDQFSIVRTMHHIAGREFRNEHNSSTYLLHTGTTELPTGNTNASITAPRQGRFEWPSIGSLLAYALPPVAGAVLPPVIEMPRVSHMKYPGRGAGVLGPRFERWNVDLAPPCKSPDPAGSCPNCFSHDDPNDQEQTPGKGPKAWWDNSSCRDPSFRLPDLGGSLSVSADQLQGRESLLHRLDALNRHHDAGAFLAHDAHHEQALRLLLTMRSGGRNPFDLNQEPDRVRDLYGREEWGQGLLVARRLVEAGVRMV